MEEHVASQAPTAGSPVEVDEVQLRTFMQRARDNQNMPLALVGGLAASVVGATLWAMITVWTGYQIGWMAIGVGFLVGYAVRFAGKGIDRSFGIAGAALALLGCVAGNLLMVCILVSRQENVALFQILSQLDPAAVVQLLKVTFRPIDLLFYAIALYEGYQVSFFPVRAEDISKMQHA